MSVQLASQPVYERKGTAGDVLSHGAVLYHLLPEDKLRDQSEGKLSLEEQHDRSKAVARGERRMRETPEETAAREAQEAADREEWAAEKARRAAASQDQAQMQAYLASKREAKAEPAS